jgi:hypothetical protein
MHVSVSAPREDSDLHSHVHVACTSRGPYKDARSRRSGTPGSRAVQHAPFWDTCRAFCAVRPLAIRRQRSTDRFRGDRDGSSAALSGTGTHTRRRQRSPKRQRSGSGFPAIRSGVTVK